MQTLCSCSDLFNIPQTSSMSAGHPKLRNFRYCEKKENITIFQLCLNGKHGKIIGIHWCIEKIRKAVLHSMQQNLAQH